MVVYLVLALLIAIVAVIFALQNITAVTISFFAWQVSGSLSLILLIALAIGFLVGILVMLPNIIKHKMQLKNLRKQKSKQEKELNDLKARLETLTKEKEMASVSPPAPPPSEKNLPEPPDASPVETATDSPSEGA